MAGYVCGKPGHDQPRKILARNPDREVGVFLSVLLAVANNLDPLRPSITWPVPGRASSDDRHAAAQYRAPRIR